MGIHQYRDTVRKQRGYTNTEIKSENSKDTPIQRYSQKKSGDTPIWDRVRKQWGYINTGYSQKTVGIHQYGIKSENSKDTPRQGYSQKNRYWQDIYPEG